MNHISANIGGHERTAYTVEHRGNCVLITGAVPASAFTVLAKLVPDDSIMSADCARLWGVTFALGPADEIEALKAWRASAAEQEMRQRHPALSAEATKWLASGERGISSNFIFTYLTGIDAMAGWSTERACHPHDPADFRRCQLLLEQAPELQPIFQRMARASNEWDRLVKSWPDIIAALDEEVPGWRDGRTGKSADKAYKIIRAAVRDGGAT